jgi:hypothetical protein
MKQLIQKKWKFTSKIFIKNDYVEYQCQIEKDIREQFIPYEQISNDISRNEINRRLALYIGIIGLIIGITSAISSGKIHPWTFSFLMVGIGFVISYNLKKVKIIELSTGKGSIIVLDNPEGNIMIDEIKRKRNEYLREKYFMINWENELTSELDKFAALKNIGAISENEFDKIRKEIETK